MLRRNRLISLLFSLGVLVYALVRYFSSHRKHHDWTTEGDTPLPLLLKRSGVKL